ncbi:hypothetical protein HPB51_002225 [Rhipicephalus microplus]|uniref:Kinesin motor domain-containing protein n=1 Tax=Rhipicephalus microplus TaxID=6941 RepID=A0A9J6E5Q1_RHIMP|nr:hypothetical protein HPB51_002225 [Rhipicephalus microplus]
MGTCCSTNDANSENAGIIPRAVQDIFRHICTDRDKVFLVRASFLEITNLTELSVTTPEETIRLLEVGCASRSTASTTMNMCSSRSHAIFRLIVKQQDKSTNSAVTVAKFHFVDLAGFERAGKVEVVRERFKEGQTQESNMDQVTSTPSVVYTAHILKPFYGDVLEDVDDWLDHFNRVAATNE